MGELITDRKIESTFTQGVPQTYEGVEFYGVSGSDFCLPRSDPDDLHLEIEKGRIGGCIRGVTPCQ